VGSERLTQHPIIATLGYMTVLLLIRHGMTDMVAQKRLAGWTPGVMLNEAGRREVYALAGRLAFVPLQAIYSSPLERTLQTAQIIAAPHGLEVQVRDGLAETRIGEWTGKAIQDIEGSEAWKALHEHPRGVRIPGGETIEEVQARMVTELEAIRQAHPDGVVAVVSHADPIRAAVCHYLGLDLNYFHRLYVSTASVTVLMLGEQGTALISLNVTGDLSYLQRAAERPEPPEKASGDHREPAAEAANPGSEWPESRQINPTAETGEKAERS